MPTTRTSVSVFLAYWEILSRFSLQEIIEGNVFTFNFNKSLERPWKYCDPILRIMIPSPPKAFCNYSLCTVGMRAFTFVYDGIEINWKFCDLNAIFSICNHLKEYQIIYVVETCIIIDIIKGWSTAIMESNSLYLSSYFCCCVKSGWSNAIILW